MFFCTLRRILPRIAITLPLWYDICMILRRFARRRRKEFPMKPIAIDDFCAVHSLANVTFSPEGTSACFTVSQAKKEKNAKIKLNFDTIKNNYSLYFFFLYSFLYVFLYAKKVLKFQIPFISLTKF